MRLARSHHPTAIAAKPQENPAFATGLPGMRLVTKTVDQADAGAYPVLCRG
jgi:catechol 2,3-dioxygenase-like lactoylglutathione lyase family enzyme